ncbi:MAG: hypothetical protein M3R14_01820 [Acidobacteriota bacterium]|nr:hypothetical protein [Acidobacteriota bacterium]
MKLRLRENSIRLRLLRGEIQRFRESGIVSEKIQFNQFQILSYTLKVSEEVKEISASFTDKEIIVEIPFAAAQDWTETNLIGLENEQKIDDKQTMKILIEKDFACPNRPFDEDNKDGFELHPKIKSC